MAAKDLIAASSGGAGAAFSTVILYPLDVLKAHLNNGADHTGKKYSGPLDVLLSVHREHGLLGFYNGLGARTLQQVVQKFTFYYVYDGLRRVARSALQKRNLPFSVTLLVGYVAGVATVLIASPLEVVSTRKQLSSKADSGRAPSLPMLFAQMVRQEGISVLYRGFIPNVILGINPAMENTIFDQIKARFLRGSVATSLSAPAAFWLGALSKIIATAVTFPYIRAKVILQAAQSKGATSDPQDGNGAAAEGVASSALTTHARRLSTLQVLARIVVEDGPLALWAGMGPQALKAVLSSAVLLAAKEKIEVVIQAMFAAAVITGPK